MRMGFREERVMYHILHGRTFTREIILEMAMEETSRKQAAQDYLVDTGRDGAEAWRKLIQDTLCRLVKKGWLVRVKRGYYDVTELGREKYYTKLAIRFYRGENNGQEASNVYTEEENNN